MSTRRRYVSSPLFSKLGIVTDILQQKKHGQAETKPFTNFSVFHDNLITRLKALSQIQSEFEKRTKDAEQQYSDKLNDMRKQLDLRWKQIDKFEASVKTIAEAKATWRKKLSAKEGEIEALQVRPLSHIPCIAYVCADAGA